MIPRRKTVVSTNPFDRRIVRYELTSLTSKLRPKSINRRVIIADDAGCNTNNTIIVAQRFDPRRGSRTMSSQSSGSTTMGLARLMMNCR